VTSRVVLNLVLLLALIGIGLYVYFAPEDKAETAFALSQLPRDDIGTIRIERPDHQPIEIEKRGESWHMLSPFNTRADPFQVDRLLDIAQGTSRQKLPREDLQRFNLDPALLTVRLNDQSFSFGSINDVTNEQYLATGDAVYLVAPYLGYGVPGDPAKLFSHKLLSAEEYPVAFNFGSWQLSRNEQGSWKTAGVPPESGADLSADELNQWAAEWQLASSLVTEAHDGSKGREQITVSLKDGRNITIEVLARTPQVILVRRDENMRYHFGADAGARLLDPRVVAASR
jgi:hypothetical protein